MVAHLLSFAIDETGLLMFFQFLKQQGICAVFKLETTLRSELVRAKDCFDLAIRNGVVYRIPCECGKVYIYETGRPMQDRIKGAQQRHWTS